MIISSIRLPGWYGRPLVFYPESELFKIETGSVYCNRYYDDAGYSEHQHIEIKLNHRPPVNRKHSAGDI